MADKDLMQSPVTCEEAFMRYHTAGRSIELLSLDNPKHEDAIERLLDEPIEWRGAFLQTPTRKPQMLLRKIELLLEKDSGDYIAAWSVDFTTQTLADAREMLGSAH